jgi:hypothetical protein
VIQGYEALLNAYRDTESFSSSFASPEQIEAMEALLPPDRPRVPQARPIGLDPPEHTKYRAPLQKTLFTQGGTGAEGRDPNAGERTD